MHPFRKYFILGINLFVLGWLSKVVYYEELGGYVGYAILAYAAFVVAFNLYAFVVYVIMNEYPASNWINHFLFYAALLTPVVILWCTFSRA